MKLNFVKVMIIIQILMFLIVGCIEERKDTIETKSVQGDIVIKTPRLEFQKEGKGLIIFTPSNGGNTLILDDMTVGEPTYNQEKTKIIAVSSSKEIIEYDVKTRSIDIVIDDFKVAYPKCVKYIPNSNNVSFLFDSKIFTYNKETKQKEVIVNVADDYCWNNEGKFILFSTGKKIYKYDVTK